MKNRRILVVSDNPAIHAEYRNSLLVQGTNYSIDFVNSGQDLYKRVAEAQERGAPYALVIMDVRMAPDLSEFEASEKIFNSMPETQIVICSENLGEVGENLNQKFKSADRLMFLKKPFDATELKQMALVMVEKWNTDHEMRDYANSVEAMLLEQTAQVKELQEKAIHSEKLVALGTVAADIAHEINTPLAVILMNSQRAREVNTHQELDAYFDKIEKTTNRIAKTIQGVLKFVHQTHDAEFTRVTGSSLIEDTLSLCGHRFKDSGIQLSFRQEGGPFELDCQPIELVQVMINLLNNAFDAVSELDEKWVKIEVGGTEDLVNFSVTDSGSGIPSDLRTKIFGAFFTTKGIGTGTGLGLNISKRIVEKNRGTITLDPLCKNTRFILSFPRPKSTSE